jgi:DNA anti-recombination protein RmuC
MTIVGVIIGSLITGSYTFLITKTSNQTLIEKEIIEERIELITETSMIFSLSPKVIAHFGTASSQISTMNQLMSICNQKLQAGESIDCEFPEIN